MKNKELSTAEKLLWLVENGWNIKCYLTPNKKDYNIIIKKNNQVFGQMGTILELKETIRQIYEWAKEQK